MRADLIDDLVEELAQIGRIAPGRDALLLAIVLQEFVGVLFEIDREKAIEQIGRGVDDARSFLQALEQQLLVLTTSLHGKHHDHRDRRQGVRLLPEMKPEVFARRSISLVMLAGNERTSIQSESGSLA